MRKSVKYFFLATCAFTTLYFIVHLYLTVNVNVHIRKVLGHGSTRLVSTPSSPPLKSKASSNSLPIKKTRKDKVPKPRKTVSKKKATRETQKKMTPFPVTKYPQMKKMVSLPVTKTPQIKKMTSLPVKKSPQMKKMASLPVTKSPQMKKMAPLPVTTSPQIKSSLSVKHSGSLQDNRTLLAVLATTWLPEKEKENVHENVARVWGSWPGIVQPVVYTNLSMTDKSFNQCIKSGWKLSPTLKTNCAGIPVLKTMVSNLLKNFPNSDFYGFVNSDILFDPGLIETFKFVKKHTKERPVLLIGQRTNVDFTKPLEVHSAKDVPQLAKKGKIMKAYAIDYFLTDRSFPWDKFPDLVIGRHQYDNYLVHFGLMQKALVIDVTQTVTAVHQTTKDGNNSGNHRHHKNCNRIMIKNFGKPFWSSWGFVTCARNYTRKNKSRNIIMTSRKPWKYCRPSSS